MEIKWECLIGIIIIVTAGMALSLGKMDTKDFLSAVGMVLAFLSGERVGIYLARREAK